ncbi:MAG: phosphoglycerate kinase [Desulfomonile tiedjei]|uniref:Phosphoglycerate kinase n=1 Tax=Desulfomonile tiedjei TaxID=2358 RepID=A0A9D6V1F1_9BACT|nr:phosphoglycerate kinase [Desulfomonile tiedjei]
MPVKSIKELDIRGKRVFFRFDFNVPLDQAGSIKDDTRIRRAIPTIKYAIEHGAKCILSSHLGRPKGELKPEMSLKPVAQRLQEILGVPIRFADDCIGPKVKEAVAALPDGGVLLLENLRFHAGETKNDPEFAAQLASLADVYVNDAFGTAHRAHASTVGVAELLKEKAAGLLLNEELENLEKALKNPAKPVVAIFGGAKVSDKLAVLENLVARMDAVLIGGGMANTFLKAQGVDVGSSKIEEDMTGTAGGILKSAREKGCAVLLPDDVVISDRIEEGATGQTVDASAIPADQMALDIGPKTIERFTQEIRKAGTIVWNGPMGVFEISAFKNGTMKIAEAVASAPGFSLVGGGDSIRAVQQAGVADRISYISTGGGAFMEFMEGKTLPGVAALE